MTELSRKGPDSTSEGTQLPSWCQSCGGETLHDVLRAAEFVAEYREGMFSITGWDTYQIVECRGCQEVGFRQTHRDTERVDHDPHTGESELVESVQVYPKPTNIRPAIRGSRHLPDDIRRVYTEARLALANQMPVLAGIGIRAIVETICKDQGAPSGNLASKIDALVEQRVLTQAGAKILHSLRTMGNRAAHEVTPHHLDQLSTAMDVVENALQAMYVLPSEASKLPEPS